MNEHKDSENKPWEVTELKTAKGIYIGKEFKFNDTSNGLEDFEIYRRSIFISITGTEDSVKKMLKVVDKQGLVVENEQKFIADGKYSGSHYLCIEYNKSMKPPINYADKGTLHIESSINIIELLNNLQQEFGFNHDALKEIKQYIRSATDFLKIKPLKQLASQALSSNNITYIKGADVSLGLLAKEVFLPENMSRLDIVKAIRACSDEEHGLVVLEKYLERSQHASSGRGWTQKLLTQTAQQRE